MPSIKIAVSVPKETFRFLEREARASGRSRSAVVAMALERLRDAATADAIRESYDRAYADPTLVEEGRAFARQAAHGVGKIMKAQDGGW